MTATVYRALYLNEFADLNTFAIGCHWSFNECIDDVVESACLSLIARSGKKMILFRTQVSSEQINWDATVYSNQEHSHEYECVMNFNEQIEIECRDEMGEWLSVGQASVGTAGHAWVLTTEQVGQNAINQLVDSLKEWATIED